MKVEVIIKIQKNFVKFIVLTILVGILLSSCHFNGKEDVSTTEAETDIQVIINKMIIVDEGIPKAQIVRPKTASNELIAAIEETTATPVSTTDKSSESAGCSCGASSIFISLAVLVSSTAVFIFTKKRI